MKQGWVAVDGLSMYRQPTSSPRSARRHWTSVPPFNREAKQDHLGSYRLDDIELADRLGGGCAAHWDDECLCDVDLGMYGGCPPQAGTSPFQASADTLAWMRRTLVETERRWFVRRYMPELGAKLQDIRIDGARGGEYGGRQRWDAIDDVTAWTDDAVDTIRTVFSSKAHVSTGRLASVGLPNRNPMTMIRDYCEDLVRRNRGSAQLSLRHVVLAAREFIPSISLATVAAWMYRPRGTEAQRLYTRNLFVSDELIPKDSGQPDIGAVAA